MTIEEVNSLLDRLSAVSKEYFPLFLTVTDPRLKERPTANFDPILPRNESNRAEMGCSNNPPTFEPVYPYSLISRNARGSNREDFLRLLAP
jgi:hypothetical protein